MCIAEMGVVGGRYNGLQWGPLDRQQLDNVLNEDNIMVHENKFLIDNRVDYVLGTNIC